MILTRCAAAILACVLVASTTGAVYGDGSTSGVSNIYDISDAEIEIVKSGLADLLVDPESVRVSDIFAGTETLNEGREIIWVCGRVQGRTPMGGYAPRTHFIGALAHDDTGEQYFQVLKIADQSDEEQIDVLEKCLKVIK